MVEAHDDELLNQKEAHRSATGGRTAHGPLAIALSRLEAALERMESGLHRVTAAQARDVQQNDHLRFFEKENAALKQEQEALNETIIKLQDDYSELNDLASSVYQRLEDSIKRLNHVVGA